MRVCIPALDPGGPEGVAATSFEASDVFDFYEVEPDGSFEHFAQTRPCLCWGPNQAEAIWRRRTEAVIVADISPSNLLKFTVAGVKVLRANNRLITALLKSFAAGKLEEIGIDKFSRVGRTKEKD